jgi:hypothetical protein
MVGACMVARWPGRGRNSGHGASTPIERCRIAISDQYTPTRRARAAGSEQPLDMQKAADLNHRRLASRPGKRSRFKDRRTGG